jgi:hypothetical protein
MSPGYNGYDEVQKSASESSTHPRAQRLHPADALTRTHREHGKQHQHQAHSTESERDSLTPPQARGLLMRTRIRAPFDGEKIYLNAR